MKKFQIILLIIILKINSSNSEKEKETINKFQNNLNNTKNALTRQELYNITNLDYFKCIDPIKDCSGSGRCSEDKDECICFEGIKTVFKHPEDYFSKIPRCNYTLKKQMYAMIIALFPSFGLTHFYLGNNLIGAIQFSLFFMVGLFNIISIVNLSLKHVKKVNAIEYRHTLSMMTFVCFLSLISFFWYLFDIFMILFNAYKDSENVELQTFYIE